MIGINLLLNHCRFQFKKTRASLRKKVNYSLFCCIRCCFTQNLNNVDLLDQNSFKIKKTRFKDLKFISTKHYMGILEFYLL